jgi:hypothetical protein
MGIFKRNGKSGFALLEDLKLGIQMCKILA